MNVLVIISITIISLLILYLIIGSFIGYDFYNDLNYTNIRRMTRYLIYKYKIENENIPYIPYNKKYILILRGHIRNSFDNNKLYNLIKQISSLYNIDIYIHTWNIFASTDSYRPIRENANKVTKQVIYNYFKDASSYIKHIIIDDSKDVTFKGRIDGFINNTRVKIKSWKYVMYAQYKIIKYIKDNTTPDETDIIINTRFDLLTMGNFISLNEKCAINFISKSMYEMRTTNKKIYFFGESSGIGIDNLYIMKINTMYEIFNELYHNLDNILIQNPDYDVEYTFYNTSLKF